VLFYVTAVVVMTGWEYFVGWLLETTTHVKYWDYSNYKFNLHGRVCLWVALVWGVLSYIIIFLVHPPIEALYEKLPLWLVYALCAILGALLLADSILTIRQLALVSRLVVSVNTAREEMQVQMSLGKAELSDKLDERADAVRDKYQEQIARLEKQSRRFRKHYAHMSISSRYGVTMDDLRAAGALAKEELQRRKAERSNTRSQWKAR
jgi:uncharacterized membrane protein